MMLVGFHDRINGHPSRVRALDRFFTYAQSHEGVWFARKDEIAKWVSGASRGHADSDKTAPTAQKAYQAASSKARTIFKAVVPTPYGWAPLQ